MIGTGMQISIVLAQAEATTGTRIAREFGREGWQGLLLVAVAVIVFVGWLYRKDTQSLNWYWKAWLLTLRLSVLIALGLIWLDPQERSETIEDRPSRVAFLIDTSLSMGFPETTPKGSAGATMGRSRSDAVVELLTKSQIPQTEMLLDRLRATHQVELHTFDSKLKQVPVLQRHADVSRVSPDLKATSPAAPNFAEILKPQGTETRLGDALVELIRHSAGETLSGIVVISDGQNNTGIESESAKAAATAAKIRLLTIGVGGTERPVSTQISSVQAPTLVSKKDGFSITAFVQGQQLAGKTVQVELLSKQESDPGPFTVVQTKDALLKQDGVPASVQFDYTPKEAGRRLFNLRVKPIAGVSGSKLVEKVLPPVEITDRNTKVLLIAGGPMRDYQFTRNLLFRDSGTDVDVWLQSGRSGISQEAKTLLFEFPTTDAELFKYDVIICFDPDWKQVPAASRNALGQWVFQHAGGLIVIAGDVYTTDLASSDDSFQIIRALYPVVLATNLFDFEMVGEEFQNPQKVELTETGRKAEFLQLGDNPSESNKVWEEEFSGVFRSYPTIKAKAGANVFANFSDRRAITENGKPILLAEQFYGGGRVLYLGSAELWRLRAVEEKFFERFWIKSIREVGQGRLLRGTNRGGLLLEQHNFALGATVPIRASVLDPQFKELVAPHVDIEVFDPRGKRLIPALRLLADKSRAGQFTGSFPANLAGRYRLELPIPDSTDQVVDFLQVEMPDLEFIKQEQDAAQLQRLATEELGGKYLTISEAEKSLPDLLPDRGTKKVQYDVPQPLWDRQWVMYLLVSLLSTEWLTRKLLKLA
ncbi:MAG: hypothetical protein JWM11_6158 [Planctomycetaceae bacterium]|nr:hypothetical protein [Planctomycetaceae bacterium]